MFLGTSICLGCPESDDVNCEYTQELKSIEYGESNIGFTEDTVIDHINIWKCQHHMLTVNDEFQCHSLHLAILAFRALIVIQRINH